MVSEACALAALAAWPLPSDPLVTPVTTGLINLTYRVELKDGPTYALQRLSPIFGKEVHQDIEAVTEHLQAKGHVTPQLIRTQEGYLDHELSDGRGLWRLMTWIDGVCYTRLEGPALAYSAGQALGQFHAALADFKQDFAHKRLGVHDSLRHLEALKTALNTHQDHRNYSEICALGLKILEAAETLEPLPPTSDRVVHGDPKVSNLVFAPSGEGRAWIDLDTVARMALPLELGDAFRSWCNPSGEDVTQAHFDIELFEASVQGYARGVGGTIHPTEQNSLVLATRWIMLELAARFCRDALEECYFGWDANRYPSRSAHNQVRAEGQWALAQDLAEKSEMAERRVHIAFRAQ